MESFRKYITNQVKSIHEGKLFTFKDLDFQPNKRANVAVVLSELTKKGELIRPENGTYYRPKASLLGLKHRPLSYQEKLSFIAKELNGYITGASVFNQMLLTEQVPMVVTVATQKPLRNFERLNIKVECVKSYVADVNDENLYQVRLLDAIKSIKDIPGTTPTDIYSRLMEHHFKKICFGDFRKIVELSFSYPPRVRRILMDVSRDLGYNDERRKLSKTLNSNTHFSLTF